MTADNFTRAARAEAERRTRPPGISGQTGPFMEQVAESDGYRRGFMDASEWAQDRLAAQEPTPADSEISGYDLAVLRSTYQAFGTRDSEWGEGAQAGMRAAAAILGITIDKEDDQ